MKTKYFVDPVTMNQVREDQGPTAIFGGRLVWDGGRHPSFTCEQAIQGAELVCKLFNLGCTDLPTIEERN